MPRPAPALRSITSRSDAVRVFAAQPSARTLGAAVAVAVALRGRARRFGSRDLVVATAVVAAQGAHEWVIHRGLLHARPRQVRGVRIDPGAGHRAHHADPDVLEHALLQGADARRFATMVAVWVALACRPARRWLAPRHVLTAVATAEAGLLAYEWTHFLDHTTVPLRSSRARRLRAHHRRHHHLDEHRWLGITATSGDRVHELVARARG